MQRAGAMNLLSFLLNDISHIMGVSEHSEVTKMQPVENEQEEKMHVVEYS